MTADRRGLVLSLAITVGLAGVLDTIVAVRMGRTPDEGAHVEYGRRVLRGEPIRDRIYFDSKMPVSALNAIPAVVAERLEDRHLLPRVAALLQDWKVARAASVLGLILLNVLVYRWAAALYGPAAGLGAAVLVVLAPNLIAHGTLATTDGYFALAVLLALYFLRRYLRQPTTSNAALSALTLALAQLTKPFALYLYPIAGIGLAASALRRPRTEHSPTARGAWLYLGMCAVAFVLMLNVGFGFYRSFLPLADYEFTSPSFERLQKRVSRTPVLQELPVPVPYAYLQGLDMTVDDEAHGRSFGNVYLLGELRSSKDRRFDGFKSYYAVAWFFKEPIALQLLLLLGLFEIRRRRPLADVMLGEGLLLLAAGGLVAYLSFFNRAQLGIRHILPALAIGVVIGAAAFARFPSLPRWRQIGLGLLLVWLALSTLRYYPHLIPYMNEWAGDRRLAYRLLADSNLDWGQNEPVVRDFLAKNPDVVLNPEEPICGRVLMSANRLTGVLGTRKNWRAPAWTWNYEPVAHVGYAHFLFDIRPDSAGATTCGARQGPPS
jgi:4-amino-4-deoxy-L-arabinose transferase-like glycosyltransferase